MCEPQWSVEYNLDHQKCRRLDLIKELQKLPDQKYSGAHINGQTLYIDGDEADSDGKLAHHRHLEQELQKMYAINTEIDARALQVAIARELADLDILTITTDRDCLDHLEGAGRQHPNSLRSSCAQSCSSSRSGGSSSCCTATTTVSTLPTASTTQPPGSLTSTLSFSAAPTQVTRPHRANDARWEAIRALESPPALHHFRLRQKLGSGDIGSVYLTELRQSGCLFAMKVMDKAALEARNKTARAVTEREILQVLDHPFLPTLYAHIEDGQYSCLVMEFCPGGDLHVLRQRQAAKRFSERAVRFYAAEVLLALEYLHMMGIVYRDLKPENVLVREDGHIMLSDFDLSMKCSVNPTLERVAGGAITPADAASGSASPPPCGAVAACAGASAACILPLGCVSPCTDGGAASAVHPVASCLPMPRMLNRKKARRRAPPLSTLPELHAEPTSARSMSFVGTHEYLAPEIILGDGHGSAVDWWTFGIFLFELLYGRTPFKGTDHEVTLMNVVTQLLRFPSSGDDVAPTPAAQDLIRGLLIKDPSKRLAAVRGASEIKQHPFFQGVNWALIRCATPPDIPPRYAPPPPASPSEPVDAVAWFEHDAPSAECLDVPDYELF